ncbi:class I SAM-dependent methyltransferase [Haloarchaeobius sp. HRN-SO-5]|uniref:class I SAM-dependent methyltransferase n=1 Tax=Haloarchaeobius sp. HRN-SO-5 TaxID=3446118 RepID=UPI003EBBE412
MSSKRHVKRVWTIGSYPDVGPNFLPMAAHLVEATDVDSNERVLDVGCGTGNVAITAARRGAQVTGLDITPAMLEDARENAAIAGVEDIEWQEGDATALPFEDGAFDVTLSCVGHMFANPPDAAAAELLRVTRSGGRIAFTSWTPRSVVPAMAKVLKEYLSPDPEAPAPPFLWGDADVVRDRLDDGTAALSFETGVVEQVALSPAHYWEGARTQSGLFIAALENVDEEAHPALSDDMVETIARYFDDSQNAVSMEYRLTTATLE